MDIKEFTKEALIQIVSALSEANDSLVEHNAFIASSGLGSSENSCVHIVGKSNTVDKTVMNVEFDLAVTASDSNGFSVSAGGAPTPVLGILFRGGTKHENQKVHRIRFSVPVALPENQETIDKIIDSIE